MGERVKLLMVEDDPIDRMAFERFVRLGNQPYDYRLATSLAAADILLAAERFDVILTDYHLGDGLGVDLLERGVDAPVVVITGAGDEETAIRAMRAGAFDYLIKDTDRGYLKMLAVTVDNAHRHHIVETTARMLSQAVRAINDGIFVSDLDNRLIFVNETLCRVYGFDEAEVLGQPCDLLWDPDAEHELPPTRADSFPAGGEQGECIHRRKDGESFPVLLSRSAILDGQGSVQAVVGTSRDVTERKRNEKALEESRERYALAAAGANDGLWDWDLRTGAVYYSPRWKLTLGYGVEEIGDAPDSWFDLVHPDDQALLRAQIDAHFNGKTPQFENEHRMRTKSGEYRWVHTRGLAVRDGNDTVLRMAGSQLDITGRKRAEAQLSYAALHDALTSLPNRALFMDRLAHAVQRAVRKPDEGFAVIFLDLDRFKVVNDSLGHAAGDQLLAGVARRLESCLRESDTVARLGGDEFVILLEDLDEDRRVDQVAHRIQQSLEEPFSISDHEIYTTASLGIALSTTVYEQPEDMLRDADTAMYRAKSLGRTRQVIFSPEMHTSSVAQLEIETELRQAVERQEFEVRYQPLLELSSGALRGFEVLVRWRHPTRGLVLPDDFLPHAADVGLSVPIGLWVLEQACRQLGRWHDVHEGNAGLSISVNIDGNLLGSPELIPAIDATLEEAGVEPNCLILDLTEGILMQRPEITTSVLRHLSSRGLQLHIDDFGTGYSSLSQLHRFPVDALKIDGTFIQRMSVQVEDREIVRTIVSLAHNLGLTVVAEGIETVEQLALLRTLGCELGQGELFAMPLRASDAGRLILEGPRLLPAFVVHATGEAAGGANSSGGK